MVEKDEAKGDRPLSRAELREVKPDRAAFAALPRRPITVALDRVRQNYNIGAIFRLCDAFLLERLIIGGIAVDLRKRKLVQAARGTQNWCLGSMLRTRPSLWRRQNRLAPGSSPSN